MDFQKTTEKAKTMIQKIEEENEKPSVIGGIDFSDFIAVFSLVICIVLTFVILPCVMGACAILTLQLLGFKLSANCATLAFCSMFLHTTTVLNYGGRKRRGA